MQKAVDSEGNEIDGLIDIKYLKTRFTGSSVKFQARLESDTLKFTRPSIVTPFVPSQSTGSPVANNEDTRYGDGGFIQI